MTRNTPKFDPRWNEGLSRTGLHNGMRFSVRFGRNETKYTTLQNLEFYNTTSGQNTSEPVYGLYDCRGDVTIQVCRTYVVAAVKEIKNKCSREKIAVIWYNECLLRYSNWSFFSTVDEKPMFGLLNT